MESTTATAAAVVLKDFAPAATSLFNNMKTPASILAGAMIPLGFLAPLPQPPAHIAKVIPEKKKTPQWQLHINKKEAPEEEPIITVVEIQKNFDRILRKSYLLVTLFSFGSELLAVMWATVAVNQLTETFVEPAASVWELLKRDWYDLAWSATNSHFVFGMLGFMWMVGTRAYLMVQAKPWNINVVSASEEKNSSTMAFSAIFLVASSFLLMVAIVNRGVASGGGVAESTYGGSVFSLFSHYLMLLCKQALGNAVVPFGPMELLSVLFGAAGFALGAKALFVEA